MTDRQKIVLQAIHSRVSKLKAQQPEWRGNSRRMIDERGFSAFQEVNHATERGCYATVASLFGKSASDRAAQARLRRDLEELERAGRVRITLDGRTRYVMPTSRN